MRTILKLASVLGTLGLAACGGGHDVTPTIITGGGISDPGIDGEVNVYAIDGVSDDPIEGATVIVGDVTGETDETGLFVADVSGAQTITVISGGFITATWVGVDGANVTIPLDVEDGGSTTPPQATLTGGIPGFTDLPPPSGGAKVAFVTYSANDDDDDPANDLPQPNGQGGLPENACVNAGVGTPTCAWSLVTRTGSQAVVAFIGDLDLSTEAITFSGFAYTSGVSVQDGVDQSGIDLEIADANDFVAADLTLGDPPSGTTVAQALVRVNLGEDGRLQLPQTEDFAVPVPALSLFAGSDYDVLAIAADDDDTNDNVQSVIFDHDVSTVDGYTVSDFIDLPTGAAIDDKTFSSDVNAEATVHGFEIENSDGERQWIVTFFDGTASVVQPDEVTLPTGSLTFRAQIIIVPDVELDDFALEDIIDQVTAISTDAIEFDN